jgi:tripartite-type tricarboxylate transporter receptor subunit TctC
MRTLPALLLASLLALLPAAMPCHAQDYPAKPVRIVVGFTPGGGPDLTARHIAQKLSESWGQQVLVENRPGAGGTVAAGQVARSAPDGYTLLSVSSAHSVAAAIYPKLPYEMKDLAGVTLTGTSKYVLVSSQFKTLRELLAAAKAKPGQINFSSAGVGSGTHFAGEIFKSMAAIDVVHVPFKGIPEALTDTMTGRVHFFMAPIANAVGPLKDGRLAALGVSSKQRDALLPDVPTVDEAGVPGYQTILWFGLLAPQGLPKSVLGKLNTDIVRVLNSPDTRAKWGPLGIEPSPTAPEEFDRVIREDTELFAKIARSANISAN